MLREIRRLLTARPFVPFTICPADGAALHVPTADHAVISPIGSLIVVFFDDDTGQFLSPLLITRVGPDDLSAM
ncbi:MAG: hypothetical protein JO333_05080 [Verrucomicrobia bacterium]|nr:hypothetical protein [Verrucomicrobiota bacterium]